MGQSQDLGVLRGSPRESLTICLRARRTLRMNFRVRMVTAGPSAMVVTLWAKQGIRTSRQRTRRSAQGPWSRVVGDRVERGSQRWAFIEAGLEKNCQSADEAKPVPAAAKNGEMDTFKWFNNINPTVRAAACG